MSVSIAPVSPSQYLFNVEFSDQSSLHLAQWGVPTLSAEYIPSTVSNGDGTETSALPTIVDGVLELPLTTYNPTSDPPGTSFQGSAIYTLQSFDDYMEAGQNAGGIAFTVVANLGTAVPGMAGGIFPYQLTNSETGLHNEIDFELRSDYASSQPNSVQTNIYDNQPSNSNGSPALVSDQNLTLTSPQTYTIEWFPNEVLWYVNGAEVYDVTQNIPQGSFFSFISTCGRMTPAIPVLPFSQCLMLSQRQHTILMWQA